MLRFLAKLGIGFAIASDFIGALDSIAALSVSNSMIDSVAIFFWLVNSVGIRSGFRNKGEKNLLRFFT